VSVDAARNLVEILLVEDSPTDVMMTQEALAYYKVLNPIRVADDGVAAMEYLSRAGTHGTERLPGLILLDLSLARRCGREVLEEIKCDPELRKISVIILITSKAEEDVVKSYGLHVNCFITKPVDLTKLFDVVRTIEEFWLGVVALPRIAP